MIEKRLIKEGNGIVYHYTSLDTLLKIFDGIKDGQLIFHGSDIFSMNDPSEFILGFKQLWSLLPQIENEFYKNIKGTPQSYNISEPFLDNKFRLSNMWNRWDGNKKSWLKAYVESMHRLYESPFVVSFSCHEDFLPMWSTYGDQGHGVAIGIDIQAYYEKKILKDGTTMLDFTSYDNKELHSILVTYDKLSINHPLAILTKLYIGNYLRSIREIDVDDEKLFQLQMRTLDSITKLASAMIKNDAYRYEEESRLISYRKDMNDVRFKVSSKKNIIPFIHIGIPVSKLKKIVIGPCCDYLSVMNAIKVRLEQKGISLKDDDFLKSTVPYRLV